MSAGITVKILPNESGNPHGKLADAELHFSAPPDAALVESIAKHLREVGEATAANHLEQTAGALAALAGMRLLGFAIWESRGNPSKRNVTFPARTYAVNGERRSFALLRPTSDGSAQDHMRELILQAYAEYEAQQAQDAQQNAQPAPRTRVCLECGQDKASAAACPRCTAAKQSGLAL